MRCLLLTLVVCALPVTAAAQDCTKRGDRVTDLAAKGYAVTDRGANQVGRMIEVLTTSSHAWVQIETWPNGCSRIVDRGALWRVIVITKEIPT